MATIATLTIDMLAKSGKLTAEFRKASKSTHSWAKRTRQMVNNTAKVMSGLGVVAGGVLTSIYAKQAKLIDQHAKNADVLGLTTKTLTGLKHGAELAGASSEELINGLRRMQKNLGQVAQTASGEAKPALDALGLSIEEIKDLEPEQQFKLIADKLSQVENSSQKVYIAQTLMGRAGVNLINLMDQGAAGIQANIDEAEQLGLTFSRIDAAKVEMANDAFLKAKRTSESFGKTLATETAPIVAALSDMWTESAIEAGGFGQVAQDVVTKVSKGIGVVSDVGRGLEVTFLLVRQATAEVLNTWIQLSNFVGQRGKPFLEMVGLDTSALDDLSNFSESFAGTTASLAQELNDLLMAPMPSEKIKNWLADVQEKVQLAAEQTAKDKKMSLSHLLLDDSETATQQADKQGQTLVEKARNQYQQIFDAQLALEGQEIELAERRYQRKLAEMEREFELLREKNLITAEIENEYRIAREQLETQHKDNLTQIEQDRQQVITQGYNQLLNVMGTYFDGMEGKHAGYARVALSLTHTLLDEEKRKSIQSIWANTYDTAMKAYNSLASIPYIGPFLGAGAAGVVIGAGTAYAAKVSGLASFDGGGYTGDGSRTGGLDGKGGFMAMVHPRETIIDHTKTNAGAQTNQKVALNYHFHGSPEENERLLNNNRNSTIRDARRLSSELRRPF